MGRSRQSPARDGEENFGSVGKDSKGSSERRVRMADTVGEKERSQTEVLGESPKNERCENY